MNVKLHPGLLVCAIVGAVLATPSGQSPQVEWFYYGGDAASSKALVSNAGIRDFICRNLLDVSVRSVRRAR